MAQQKSGQDVTAGAGRRDEVGKTGVYPATGPYPEGDAKVVTPDEINKGRDHDRQNEEETEGAKPGYE